MLNGVAPEGQRLILASEHLAQMNLMKLWWEFWWHAKHMCCSWSKLAALVP